MPEDVEELSLQHSQSLRKPGHLGGLPGTFSFLTGQSA